MDQENIVKGVKTGLAWMSIFECHLDPVQGSNIEVKRSWWNYCCAPKLSALAPVGLDLKRFGFGLLKMDGWRSDSPLCLQVLLGHDLRWVVHCHNPASD